MVLDRCLRLAAFLKPLNRGTSAASIDTARPLSPSWAEWPRAATKRLIAKMGKNMGIYDRKSQKQNKISVLFT
jgi:hypothetical protein